MGEITVILIFLGVVAAITIAIIAVRAHEQRKQLESFTRFGWTYVSKGSEQVAYGLNAPPFGIGLKRKVGAVVEGNAPLGFRAFRYSHSTWSSPGFIVVFPLPRSWASFFAIHRSHAALSVDGFPMGTSAGRQLLADDVDTGSYLAAHWTALASLPQELVASVVVDGNSVFFVTPCTNADSLNKFVHLARPLVEQVQSLQEPRLRSPLVPSEFSIYRQPSWIFRDRDDSCLALVNHSNRGMFAGEASVRLPDYDPRLSVVGDSWWSSDKATEIIMAPYDGLPFEALRHDWTTTTGSGDSSSTQHHREFLLEFHLRFWFPDISVNRRFDGIQGGVVDFESVQFNNRFDVRCQHEKFAYDVMHPRQMEFLMSLGQPSFVIRNGRITVTYSGKWAEIGQWLELLNGFFGRVPDFVWRELCGRRPEYIPDLV